MNDRKRRLVLLVSLSMTLALAVGGIIAFGSNSTDYHETNKKEAYQLYRESHPEYTKTEEEFLDDLINGRLADKKQYTVRFETNGGSSIASQTIDERTKVSKPEDPIREGYTFKQWLYQNEPWSFKVPVCENMTLSADWQFNIYHLEYDLNGGVIEHENPAYYNIGSKFDLNSPTKVGYTFSGWRTPDGRLINSIPKGTTGDMTLVAEWDAELHSLSVISESTSKGTVECSGSGYTNEQIELTAIPISPYQFKGWYDSNDQLISGDKSYSFVMPNNDVSIVAKFDETRTLTLVSDDPAKGTVEGSGNYVVGGNVQAYCSIIGDNVLKGWYDSNDVLVSSQNPYSFVMPVVDYELTAKFMTEEEIEQDKWDKAHGVIPVISEDQTTLTYGMYPQSVVDDMDLIAELDELTSPNEYGYYEYDGDFYVKKVAKPFDFSWVVPASTYVAQDFDNGEHIERNSSYWFKLEPISWDILSLENGRYSLISSKLLDSLYYNESENPSGPGGIIKANNYKESSLRKWLTGEFYDKSFALCGDEIQEIVVDNSVESTGATTNPYVCENTNDKVYAPSVKELKDLYKKDDTPWCITTDFSRTSGIYYDLKSTTLYCADYWTRSPFNNSESDAYRGKVTGYINACGVKIGSNAVRPCITIEVK